MCRNRRAAALVSPVCLATSAMDSRGVRAENARMTASPRSSDCTYSVCGIGLFVHRLPGVDKHGATRTDSLGLFSTRTSVRLANTAGGYPKKVTGPEVNR